MRLCRAFRTMKKNKNLPVPETGGELIIEPERRPEPNEYLLEFSRKIKLAKILVIFLTVVFIVGMIFFFRNDITLENYRYLIRFFSTSGEYNGDYRTVNFDSASTTAIGVFHGDLATVSVNEVNLYTMKGSNTLKFPMTYGVPTLVTEGKYMLVYDSGGNSFQLFNNFSALAGETFDFPISTAAISEEGMYAVVTKSLDYQSVIHVYDHNFKLLSNIYKDKYVSDVEIMDDGSEFMVISFYSEDGGYRSEIMTCLPYNDSAKSSNILTDEIALMGGYFKSGGYAVLTNKAVIFYDSDDNEISRFALGNIIPTKCDFNDDYVTLTYNENIVGSDTGVIILSPDGSESARYSVPDKILDIATYDKYIFVLSGKTVTRLTSDGNEQISRDVESGCSRIFICDGDTLIIGYSNMIEARSVSEMFADQVK